MRAIRHVLIVAVLFSAEAHAQTWPPKRSTIVSIQPLSIPFTTYQMEVERVLKPTTSLAVSGSSWNTESGSRRRLSADVKLRLFPAGRAPEGFSIAAAAGLMRVTQNTVPGEKVSDVGYAMGVFVDHAWLFAPANRYYAAVGLGAKWVRTEVPPLAGDLGPTNRYLAFRFSVGAGF